MEWWLIPFLMAAGFFIVGFCLTKIVGYSVMQIKSWLPTRHTFVDIDVVERLTGEWTNPYHHIKTCLIEGYKKNEVDHFHVSEVPRSIHD